MHKEDRIIQEIKSEKDDSYSDDSIFSISSWGADLSFRELIQRYDENALLKPEIQRKYVWDRTEASRFIDSILLGLPIPSIFLAKTSEETMIIVDGYQRIMTVRDYVSGVFSTDGKVFKLTRSPKINSRWRGRAFGELMDSEQRRIKNTTIHAIVFVQNKPADDDTSLEQIFERINTSGRTLLPQEIRNCVSQGPFNQLLLELNEFPKWRSLFGLPAADSRMRDIEYILRFLAMDSSDFRTEKREAISLKQFLNLFMKKHRAADPPTLLSFRKHFAGTLDLVYELFGDEAFQNISAKNPDKLVPKFNPTICDSIMLASSIFLRSGSGKPTHDFRAQRRQLLEDKEYQDAIRYRTTNTANIVKRISRALQFIFGLTYEQQVRR